MERKRDNAIDAVRGIAMLSVIVGHSLKNATLMSFIFSFHMPLFFFISGYLFSAKPGKVKKTLVRTAKPYFFTGIVYVVLATIQSCASTGSFDGGLLLDRCLAVLYMSGARTDFFAWEIPAVGAIWFLAALFWATAFLWLIVKYTPDTTAGEILRAAIVAVLFIAGWQSAFLTWLPFSIQAGMCATLFMYAGWFCKKRIPFRSDWGNKGVRALVFVACLAIWALDVYAGAIDGKVAMVAAKYPDVLLNIVGALAAIYVIFRLVDATIGAKALAPFYRYFSWIGRNTMTVLCFHLLELIFIPWSTLTSALFPGLNSYVVLLLVFAEKFCWASAWVGIVNHCQPLKKIFS